MCVTGAKCKTTGVAKHFIKTILLPDQVIWKKASLLDNYMERKVFFSSSNAALPDNVIKEMYLTF